ncbi:hypothetical protein Tco_0115281 [Tanacetum coccineum]
MANLSEDIQCAGSDTRPPMLDKADFASWQQRIRLYCWGMDNGMNKDRYNATIRATNTYFKVYQRYLFTPLIITPSDAKDIWASGKKKALEGSELTKKTGLFKKCPEVDKKNKDRVGHKARTALKPNTRPQNSEYFKDKMLLMQAQENGVVLDEEQLLFLAGGQDNAFDEDVDEQPVQDLALNVDNVFQADDYDAYDSDVDEAPMAQTFYKILDPLSRSLIVIIMTNTRCIYKTTAVPVVNKNNASMVPNDAYVMIDNENDRQLRIVICDRNIKEENLKKELHSVKLQLASTIQHNTLMVDEVTSLKKDFNQKENKYLEEFLDLKALKDKVEDKLFKQGQSIQTVHMMCKPRSYYDEVNKVAIGYKNPLCLHRARQVQPALYSGHVIVTPNQQPP